MSKMTCTTTPSVSYTPLWIARIAARFALPIAVLAFATAGLQAQAPAQTTSSAAPALNLRSYLSAPLNLAAPDLAAPESSSSSVSTPDDPSAGRLSFDPGGQPPPRRSYGRPRYSDGSHNADGSKKYTFEFGAGLTVPVSDTHTTFTPGYKFQVGGGRNFDKNFALLAQFDWDNFGIQTGTLNNLLSTYQSLCGTGCTGSSIQRIGGSMHNWSLSLNPVYNIAQSDKAGMYVVGGVGFYHKATNITTPATGTYCDYYYGCYQYQANASIDKYTSNAPGINGGVGFTYRASRFNDMKFFAEVRYTYTFNDPRPYYDGTTGTKLSPTYFNLFPQNSAKTSYLPITFGIRF